MILKLTAALLFSLFLNGCESANILTLSVVLSPSHYLYGSTLFRSLAENGHNVTVLTIFEDKFKHPNYHHILMEGAYDYFYKGAEVQNVLSLIDNTDWGAATLLFNLGKVTCEHGFSTSGWRRLMSYPKDYKFDLIIFDIGTGHCFYPLSDRFGRPPLIGLSIFFLQPDPYWNIPQTYIPLYTREYSDRMTLWERLDNTFWVSVMTVLRKYSYLPEQNRLARVEFGEHITPIEDIERNISLVLYNYHPAIDYPMALPPNIIPIGGLQIKPPKAVPREYKEILEKAKDGVIVFSLGTNVKSIFLGEERINSLLKVFGRLKQTVIWKFEADNLENVPKNVIIRKWLPQSDIIAHPNVKLLIIHGGLLSSHEALYHGKPMILLPFFLDQRQNVHRLVTKGVAWEYDAEKLNDTDAFYNTIIRIMKDSRYTEKVKRISEIYRDRPQQPMEVALYWIQYVLKFGTVSHYDLATRDMNILKLTNADLLLTVLLGLCFVMVLSSLIACKIVSTFVRRGKKSADVKKKQ